MFERLMPGQAAFLDDFDRMSMGMRITGARAVRWGIALVAAATWLLVRPFVS